MKGDLRVEKLLPLACIGGGLLLFASQFMTIFELNSAGSTPQALVKSVDQHWYAMGILGLFGALVTVGAVGSGSKPLALAPAAAGGAALLLFLLIDLPDAGTTGNLKSDAIQFLTAEADPAGGFWIELIGALILAVCGGALATMTPDQLRSLRPSWPRTLGGLKKRRPRGPGGLSTPPWRNRGSAINADTSAARIRSDDGSPPGREKRAGRSGTKAARTDPGKDAGRASKRA